MLPLEVLIAMTPYEVMKNLGRYRLMYPRTTTESEGLHYQAVVYGGSQVAQPELWVKEMDAKSPARVECTCTYFQMNLETVLAIHGSATPKRSGGVIPKKQNPKLRPGLCPHLFLLATMHTKAWAETKPKTQAEKPKTLSAMKKAADEAENADGTEVQGTPGVNPRLKSLR